MIIKDAEKEIVVVESKDLSTIKSKAEAIFLAVKEAVLAKCKIVEGVNVTDPTSCNTAQQLAKDLNNAVKTIEEKRKEMKQPSLDEGAMIDSIAKLLTVPAKKAIDICKDKIKTYDDDLIAKEKKAAELNAPIPTDLFAPEQEAPVVISESNVSKRMGWEFEIMNGCAIPKEWLLLDEAKVKAWMKERGKDTIDGEIVNGVKFKQTSTVILR